MTELVLQNLADILMLYIRSQKVQQNPQQTSLLHHLKQMTILLSIKKYLSSSLIHIVMMILNYLTDRWLSKLRTCRV